MKKKTARNKVLIATLPKSRTWYSHSFFWCYSQLLRRSDDYLMGKFVPDLLVALRDKEIGHKSTYHSDQGLHDMYICHAICPGFQESEDIRHHEWESLYFPLPYNWGETYIQEEKSWDSLNPAGNADARIVYLYRNPLDHFVSYYSHIQNHVVDKHRYYLLPDGKRRKIKNLHDFVFEFGALGAFIKHYYSFRQMAALFPGQVMLMPYEQLTTDPRNAFEALLSFIGMPMDNPLKRYMFSEALTMSSKESMVRIEETLGRSLIGDQINNGRHIRDGRIGKWKEYFSDGDVRKIESIFRMFDMSLNEFTLGSDVPGLIPAAIIEKQQHQIDFLQRQLQRLATENNVLQEKIEIRGIKIWQSLWRRNIYPTLHAIVRPAKKGVRELWDYSINFPSAALSSQ